MIVAVETPRGFVDEISDHFVFGVELGERELDGLLRGEGFSPGDAFAGVCYGFVDAILRRADA